MANLSALVGRCEDAAGMCLHARVPQDYISDWAASVLRAWTCDEQKRSEVFDGGLDG